MPTETLQHAESVLNNALNQARNVSELAYIVVVVAVCIVVPSLAFMLLHQVSARNERREASEERKTDREDRRKHDNLVAVSHERMAASNEQMAEALCRLAASDERSVECQVVMQKQLAVMQERGIRIETVVEECLEIAEREVDRESLRADISSVRKRLGERRV